MRPFSVGFVTLVICSLLLYGFKNCDGRVFSFKMHHRFTDTVKNRTQFAGIMSPAGDWPAKGSHKYYAELARHDRFRHGRRLAEADSLVAFSDGNSTVRMSSLGFLHYATVKLGTPGMKFLVALDTGSDLFWVPCECSKCASTKGTTYASEFELSIYDPEKSSTSRRVGCNDNICTMSDNCQDTPNICPYTVSYVSDQTSSSGVLVEGVLHLMTEDEPTEAYVPFGFRPIHSSTSRPPTVCSGSVWRNLRFQASWQKRVILPILSRCVSDPTESGESTSGIKPKLQHKHRSNPGRSHRGRRQCHSSIRHGDFFYVLVGPGLHEGSRKCKLLEPTGPVLVIPIGSRTQRFPCLCSSIHKQETSGHPPDSRIPFEFCYDMSSDANSSSVPSLGLVMKGGSQFSVHDPLAIISTQDEFVYCLAIVKSAEINIIGQNFMTRYRVVFDREKLVLGWKKFSCKSLSMNPNTKIS